MILGRGPCYHTNGTLKKSTGEVLCQWVKQISPELKVKGFKKCSMSDEVNRGENKEVLNSSSKYETRWEF
jgi:hypothetical protein